MAVDTSAKRLSMLNFADGDLLPEVDGGIEQDDKQTLLDCYGGITFSGAAVTPKFRRGMMIYPGRIMG